MRRFRASLVGALLLGVGVLGAYSVPGQAQNFAPKVTLYGGERALGEGIKLGGWGSGMASEDGAYKTIGDASIKVETNGYYSGARIQFESPKNITDQKNDPYGFLEFTIRFQQGTQKKNTNMSGGSDGPLGGSGGSGGSPPGFGGAPAGGSGGLDGGPGFPGGLGAPGGGAQGETLTPDTRKLKVLLNCTEGTFVSSNFPVALFPAQEEGWFSVAIPFIAFKGLDKAETVNVKEVRVFGDNKDTFWIGEIKTTTNEEPITVDGLDDLEVSVGEPVEFRASATGGISPLQYVWDFDQSDGPNQEDATGQVVTWQFRKPSPGVPGRPGELQPLVVTLTVRDLSGAKKPERRTANIIVNP